VKGDGQRTTAVREPGPAERWPQVYRRYKKGPGKVG
jgi:hypothetical protein